jgi:hypothetical protein
VDTEPKITPPHLAGAEQLAAGEPSGDHAFPLGIPGRARSERITRALFYVILIFVAILFFVPFLWSVSTSLKTTQEAAQGFDLCPTTRACAPTARR